MSFVEGTRIFGAFQGNPKGTPKPFRRGVLNTHLHPKLCTFQGKRGSDHRLNAPFPSLVSGI